jgi:hypothetical protein
MDPFRWVHHFDVFGISDPQMSSEFYSRIPTLMLDIFLCGVTIGVLDPDWIFHASFRSETLVLNPCVAHFFYGVGLRKFSLDPQNVVFRFGSVPFICSDPLFYNNRNICFY